MLWLYWNILFTILYSQPKVEKLWVILHFNKDMLMIIRVLHLIIKHTFICFYWLKVSTRATTPPNFQGTSLVIYCTDSRRLLRALYWAISLGIENEAISSTAIKYIDQGLYVIETEYVNPKNVLLYSLDGRLLLNETVQRKNIEINLNSFPKGIYLLKINNQEFRLETKLVH